MINLEKPTELAIRLGLPVSVIRQLVRSRQLEHVYVTPGKRNPLIPTGAWEKYLEASKVRSILEDQPAKGAGNGVNVVEACRRAGIEDCSGSTPKDEDTGDDRGAKE